MMGLGGIIGALQREKGGAQNALKKAKQPGAKATPNKINKL